jgi:hypothetical protein
MDVGVWFVGIQHKTIAMPIRECAPCKIVHCRDEQAGDSPAAQVPARLPEYVLVQEPD